MLFQRPVTLLGVPWDGDSSFLRGAAAAPPQIRAALRSESSNLWAECGVDLGTPDLVDDAGDVTVGETGADMRKNVEAAVLTVLDRSRAPLVLGGDHSITLPVLRAFRGRHAGLTLLHIDAHPDLYDAFEGNHWSHACPIARVCDEALAHRILQVGIRARTGHQAVQAARHGVEVYGMDRWADVPLEALGGPVYVTVDLDGIDPAHVPGVSHPEPGGLSVRDAISLIHRIRGPIVGADIVEYNPAQDVRDLTARVAAKLLKELAGAMITNVI